MIELSFFIIGLSRESVCCVFVPVWVRLSSYFWVNMPFHMKSRCCVTGWWLRLAAADCIRLLLLSSGYGYPLLVPNRFRLSGSFLKGVF